MIFPILSLKRLILTIWRQSHKEKDGDGPSDGSLHQGPQWQGQAEAWSSEPDQGFYITLLVHLQKLDWKKSSKNINKCSHMG